MLSLLLASFLTLVELNCENLFDCHHDSLKQDYAFLPDGTYRWTPNKYWKKLNNIGQTILSCSDSTTLMLPDIVALTEVENDSVMRDLTKRSLLRNAKYEYIMTSSPDIRGIDVVLMYSPASFHPLFHASIPVPMPEGSRPTRDILYVKGETHAINSLHLFVVHAPSRAGGELRTRKFRMLVAEKVCHVIDSINNADKDTHIVVVGDFNDYAKDASLKYFSNHGMTNISASAKGSNGAKGTYRYQGEWGSLDHILINDNMLKRRLSCRINDAPFLTEEDAKFGGRKPRRNLVGPSWRNGYSDHLPLVAVFSH